MDFEEIEGIRYLSQADLIYINKIALSYTPLEKVGVMNENDFIYGQQVPAIYRSYENCNDIFTLAAVFYIRFCHKHAFHNGNNRTAFIAVCVFLEINGYCFEPCLESTLEAATAIKEKCTVYCDPQYLSSWFYHYSNEIDLQKESKALSFSSDIIELVVSDQVIS
jgi:death-on-curing protein